MINSKTAALHRSAPLPPGVTCRRCRMSFRVGAPADSRHNSDITICAERGCGVPFWHRAAFRDAKPKFARVGVYPADVVAHRAAWVSDIEAGEAA
jgi:hypothetical protein